jgi:hypothetical protein
MHDIQTLVGTKEIKKNWDSKKRHVSRKSSRGPFWVTRAEVLSALKTSELQTIKFNYRLININDELHHPHQIP